MCHKQPYSMGSFPQKKYVLPIGAERSHYHGKCKD
nr:MAG TPA: hypothetical protein [Caudoviricetes sp.]